MPDPTTPRPGFLRWYIPAIILMIAGFFIGPFQFMRSISQLIPTDDAIASIEAPGETVFHADKPGTFLICDETKLVWEGRRLRPIPPLPDGIALRIAGPPGSGAITPAPAASWHFRVGDRDRQTVYKFAAPAPGDYRISVSGDFPNRTFVIGPDRDTNFFAGFLRVMCLALVGSLMCAAGFTLLILTLVLHAVRVGTAATK